MPIVVSPAMSTGQIDMAASSPRPSGASRRAVRMPVTALRPTIRNRDAIVCATVAAEVLDANESAMHGLEGALCRCGRGDAVQERTDAIDEELTVEGLRMLAESRRLPGLLLEREDGFRH